MCLPELPQPDNYDHNYQVRPHFFKNAGLTSIPRGHFYNLKLGNSKADDVRLKIGRLYTKYGLKRCPRHGLYWAGTTEWTCLKDREKTMILVVDLEEEDREKWRLIDSDVRTILRTTLDPDGRHGICVRYYIYDPPLPADVWDSSMSQMEPLRSQQRGQTNRLPRIRRAAPSVQRRDSGIDTTLVNTAADFNTIASRFRPPSLGPPPARLGTLSTWSYGETIRQARENYRRLGQMELDFDAMLASTSDMVY